MLCKYISVVLYFINLHTRSDQLVVTILTIYFSWLLILQEQFTKKQPTMTSRPKMNDVNGNKTNGHVTQRKSTLKTNGYGSNGSSVTMATTRDNGKTAKVPEESSLLSRIFNYTLVPLFLIAFSPNISILLWHASANNQGSLLQEYYNLQEVGFVRGLWNIWMDLDILSSFSCMVILGYCVFSLVLMKMLPGPTTRGPVTPKGHTPVYRDNGFKCFLVTMVTFGIVQYILKSHYNYSATMVYDRFGDFLVTLTIFSHILCIVLNIKGLYAPSTADCGSSGNPLFDYYWGTELYPNILGIDIKVFTNCRFGMTVWPLLVTIHALKSYELYGFVDSMWVSWFLQMVYFVKFFWWESGYMRTIDIMVDRAGFYICWGCLTFIPGVYASVTMYLVNQPVQLGPYLSSFLLVFGTAAVGVNYWADRQKLLVRDTDGQCMIWGRQAEVIRAEYTLDNGETRESILLVSGWWGVARHFHYVPELMLAMCWTLPALFYNLAPYCYIITLTCILVHRTYRDDNKCSDKYKTYWKQYCEKVPYKMIPGIF